MLWTNKLNKSKIKLEVERLIMDFIDYCNFTASYLRILEYINSEGRARFNLALKFSQQANHKSIEVS